MTLKNGFDKFSFSRQGKPLIIMEKALCNWPIIVLQYDVKEKYQTVDF